MSKLCSNAANCGIKKIQDALPESLKTKISQSINISTYVFVMKNIEQAKKLLKFLEEKGFSNISIDSKGTTITAQSSTSQSSNTNSVNNDSNCDFKGNKTTACSKFKTKKDCTNHFQDQGGKCWQCKWNSVENGGTCLGSGCAGKCPV